MFVSLVCQPRRLLSASFGSLLCLFGVIPAGVGAAAAGRMTGCGQPPSLIAHGSSPCAARGSGMGNRTDRVCLAGGVTRSQGCLDGITRARVNQPYTCVCHHKYT